ncbi:hypothetical protein [Amycolatopsis sp. NPDC004378]
MSSKITVGTTIAIDDLDDVPTRFLRDGGIEFDLGSALGSAYCSLTLTGEAVRALPSILGNVVSTSADAGGDDE